MFFFIGGIQPKTKVLDDAVRVCPACGRMTLRHHRTDRYLSLFFIPLAPVNPSIPRHECRGLFGVNPEPRFSSPPSKAGLGVGERVKRGIPYYACENCGAVHDEAGGIGAGGGSVGPWGLPILRPEAGRRFFILSFLRQNRIMNKARE